MKLYLGSLSVVFFKKLSVIIVRFDLKNAVFLTVGISYDINIAVNFIDVDIIKLRIFFKKPGKTRVVWSKNECTITTGRDL